MTSHHWVMYAQRNFSARWTALELPGWNSYKNETLDSAGAPVLGSEWGHLAFCTSRIERVVYFSATKTASTLPVSKATYYSRRLAPRPPLARTARAKPRARTPS